MNYMMFVKQHKTLIGIGVIVLLLGMVYRFYPSLGQMVPQRGETELKLKRLSKYQQKVQARDSLQARQVALTRQLDSADRALLNADTPALAAVDIQNVINEIIYANNMDVGSVRVLQAQGCASGGLSVGARSGDAEVDGEPDDRFVASHRISQPAACGDRLILAPPDDRTTGFTQCQPDRRRIHAQDMSAIQATSYLWMGAGC